MRNKTILAIAFIVSIPLGLLAQDEGFYPYSFARLSYVNGSVYVQRASDLGYEKGEVNLALVQGDKIGTEDGQAEIHFGRRNYLRLDANTKAEFVVLPQEGEEHIRIHLLEGSAYLRVSALVEDKGIEIHTPDVSFYILEEGLYRFNVAVDRETVAYVREGSLEAAVESGSVLVRDKESVAAAEGRLLGDPEYYYSRNDAFDDWNFSRDEQLAQRSPRQYLPSDLEDYEEELDQNGQWVYERPYGNVWVPNVTAVDWRPYLYGRWVWYPVIGWNWVSSEPWGWAVYHYGRWHWRVGLGWYWIPQSYWGPAWVHWWWDNDYIGWCPLSWYNRPVVLVNNFFYDRYYDRGFPAHNRALTVVRRSHLQSPDLARRQLRSDELGRINVASLKEGRPSLRPVADNARPEALAAKRALALKPGSRSSVRSVPPADAVTSSRLRSGAASSRVKAGTGAAQSADPGRGAPARQALRDPGSEGRNVRSYPSQRVAPGRERSGASVTRQDPSASTVRKSGSDAGAANPRVASSPRTVSTPSRPEAKQENPRTKAGEEGSKGTVVKKGETIKKYPSSARSEASSFSARASSSARAARPSASYPSRMSQPEARTSGSAAASPRSSTRTSALAPRPTSRSAASSPARVSGQGSSKARSSSSVRSGPTSVSRSSSAKSPAPQSSRRSYSSPSRSGGSSGRSVSAPRASSSSSSRSSSVSRSSGSSSGRSASSSGRSSSSSSRGSSSSSKSGSVKRKG